MLRGHTAKYHPKTNSPSKVMILCQHDGDGRDFLTQTPHLPPKLGVSAETIIQYFQIERDIGSSALVDALTKFLSLDILVLEFNLPRGIVDPNRYPIDALSRLFKLEEQPEFREALLAAHRDYTTAVESAFSEFGPQFYLDIHTMSGYSLSAPARTDSIEGHIESWLNNRGKTRAVDLITKDQNGKMIADDNVTSAIETAFTSLDIRTVRDDPFKWMPNIRSTAYLERNKGAAVDIPKPLLCINPDGALDELIVDIEKVEKIARAIARELNKLFPR
ncbi:MAG: hypothetical protein ACP5N9_05570 [Candidatus Bilamarchaeum sp.]